MRKLEREAWLPRVVEWSFLQCDGFVRSHEHNTVRKRKELDISLGLLSAHSSHQYSYCFFSCSLKSYFLSSWLVVWFHFFLVSFVFAADLKHF